MKKYQIVCYNNVRRAIAPNKDGDLDCEVTSHRNLSQLGTCCKSAINRQMAFGDANGFGIHYFPSRGKSVGDEKACTYKSLKFLNKLFRFVRS